MLSRASVACTTGMHDDICSRSFLEFSSRITSPIVNAVPYPHVNIHNVFNDRFLRECLAELKDQLTANFKETDLFKVYQTTDLANLQDCVPRARVTVPHLFRLRQYLYSEAFRDFIVQATGCGSLDGAVDCSCNIYTAGCHLLCHDDVIGTRRISYIIYLSEPDEVWTDTDGGQLELYPIGPDGKNPTDSPVVSMMPEWNSMVLFEVLPGHSFHAVREVSSITKTRVSISGWFHAKQIKQAEKRYGAPSTLQQLQAAGDIYYPPYTSVSIAARSSRQIAEHELSSFLHKWVKPEYLIHENIIRIREHFQNEGSIQLHDFLLPSIADSLREKLKREDSRNRRKCGQYDYACGHGWSVKGPPHIRRYLSYQPDSARTNRNDVGDRLEEVLINVTSTVGFQNWLSAVTGFHCTHAFSEIRRFRAGLDYTLAHSDIFKDSQIDVDLCFTSGPSQWLSGDLGGYQCFTSTEATDGAADVYSGDIAENESLRSIAPTFNSLTLVKVDKGITNFVKFISTHAKGSRWDITSRFVVAKST